MAYIKIYSATEIDTSIFDAWLRFDYKDLDEDNECPYEYFYDDEDEEYTEELRQEFHNQLHIIYATLDAFGINYCYDILDGEHKDEDDPRYIAALAKVRVSRTLASQQPTKNT